MMQKIATRVFISSSLAFGTIGVVHVLTLPGNDNDMSAFNILMMRLLLMTGFIVLSSFALSVATKYLKEKP